MRKGNPLINSPKTDPIRKEFPQSATPLRNPLFTPKMSVVCTGFPVRAASGVISLCRWPCFSGSNHLTPIRSASDADSLHHPSPDGSSVNRHRNMTHHLGHIRMPIHTTNRETPRGLCNHPGSSGFRSNDRAGGLIDLLDLEPVLGMFRLHMPHQRFDDDIPRFPLHREATVHPQFPATDRHRHFAPPVAQIVFL